MFQATNKLKSFFFRESFRANFRVWFRLNASQFLLLASVAASGSSKIDSNECLTNYEQYVSNLWTADERSYHRCSYTKSYAVPKLNLLSDSKLIMSPTDKIS